MKFIKQVTVCSLLATMAVAVLAPAGMADSRQSNKNNWRNLGAASGAVAVYGLAKHNTTATVLGAAGAAYSAHRYEQDRHSQDANKRARAARYYRAHHHRYHRKHK